MIKFENHLGVIDISEDFVINLVSNTVTNCFGVADMSDKCAQKGITGLMYKYKNVRPIVVKSKSQGLVVEVRIVVRYGMNISAIVRSIINKVSYNIKEITGLDVYKVNVFVDSMIGE